MNDFSPSRRDLLRLSALGVLASPVTGWFQSMAAHAGEGKAAKRCILLYMSGGPSHTDTFDPKAESTEFKAIPTAVPGIEISEHLPKLAKQMKDIALIRGMSTSEGSHPRANYLAHTGYREGPPGTVHPTLGSIASISIGEATPEIPNFVCVNTGGRGAGRRQIGTSYLGPAHSPMRIEDPASALDNIRPNDSLAILDRKASVLDELERGFLGRKQSTAVEAHRQNYQSAIRLMHSKKSNAFDLSAEPESVRKTYGSGKFGEGCLLARRLIEVGVPFVEVDMGGWDTHRDNFEQVKTLSGSLDEGMSALLQDLKSRGLLDSTLVVWMGDFGRDPKIRGGGRGHWPKAWSSLLAGGGVKTGQVIGRTDKTGASVEERPVSTKDFMATVCMALGVDYNKEFMTRNGRPMRVVEKGENPLKELFA